MAAQQTFLRPSCPPADWRRSVRLETFERASRFMYDRESRPPTDVPAMTVKT